ncbi:MAG: hypothetical protein ACYS30_25815 [Planctomycetota bacterium]
MEQRNEQLLQKLPSVDTLLKDPDLESYITGIGREVVVDSIRQAVDELRQLLITQKPTQMDGAAIRQKIIADTKRRLNAITSPHYRRVINATGIILHTGLGRVGLFITPAWC